MNSSNELNKESKNIINNLKSDYFLGKVFNILKKKKSLSIIKYNKNLKKRINIKIKDYRDYSEIYSSIEIELKPANNKYGKFINFDYEANNEKYFHIYFNNNKEEIKRKYINEGGKIRIIKIMVDYQIKSFKNLFKYCNCIESIYFPKFYRNNINNMSYMFYECSSLKELNLNNFKTNNVTDMSFMFSGCSSLNELNLNNFNTDNVTNMSSMFDGCSSLKELNINNFKISNDTIKNCMFYGCSSLKELNFYNFNINNINEIISMSIGCSNELGMKIKTQFGI